MKTQLLGILLCLFVAASGQNGILDTSFANDGVFIDSALIDLAYVSDVVELGHGIYLTGIQNNSASVLKLKHNGERDSLLGNNGLMFPLGITNGTIVSRASSCLFPLNNNTLLIGTTAFGSLGGDTVYLTNIDTNGVVIGQTLFDFHQHEWVVDIFQQSNQRILVGARSDNRIRFYGFDTALQLDSSFGNNGWVQSPTPQTYWQGYDIAMDESDRPIIAMHRNGTVTMSRFTSNGVPDSSFGNIGYVQINPDILSEVNTISVSSDQFIYVTGRHQSQPSSQKKLILLSDSGEVVQNFGYNGSTVFNSDYVNDSFLQQDGKLLTVGGPNFQVIRFLVNGQFDSTFAQNGEFVSNLGIWSATQAGTMQSDGKIVVVGTSRMSNYPTFYRSSAIRLISGVPININENELIHPELLFFPNPFIKSATLQFKLLQDALLNIELVNTTGSIAKNLAFQERFLAGENEIQISDFEDLPPGQYFIVISTSTNRVSIPIVKSE